MPLGFGPTPEAGIRFPSVIIEVTPDEFEKIEAKELPLPSGWEFKRRDFPAVVGCKRGRMMLFCQSGLGSVENGANQLR